MGYITEDGFWKAIDVWIKKVHVVNKRLWGCTVESELKIKCDNPSELIDTLKTNTPFNKNIDEYFTSDLSNFLSNHQTSNSFDISVSKLFPKLYTQAINYQINVVNRLSNFVLFINVVSNTSENVSPSFPYCFYLNNNDIQLKCFDGDKQGIKWLTETVLPQIIKWSLEENYSTHGVDSSLGLVDSEKYYHKYNQLKIKYGKELVKIWPECTDPSKFVYEDVAIASYLLLIWQKQRDVNGENKLQTFADLGCGNGLLVYILTSEGHSGIGIDVRKRKIWDIYPKIVVLKETTVTPSESSLFPDTDWIIGNHSDELTPWIPVISTLSSPRTNFFLLPCCSYNFNGTKYQRRNASNSLYNDYINYITEVCNECGFVPKLDRLKIPSTKRICIVGDERNYSIDGYEKLCQNVHNLINSNCALKDKWLQDFKARPSEEKVRNCTQINKSIINDIVKLISEYLLKDFQNSVEWYEGSETQIKDLITIIPQELISNIKSECGGLQTLMKNNHHIFKVERGKVKFRHPITVDQLKCKTAKIKNRECWFYANHPQGCPLSDQLCTYLHQA